MRSWFARRTWLLLLAAVCLAPFVLTNGLANCELACGYEKPASAKSKPAASAEVADSSGDEDDLGLDEGLSALVVPARYSAKVKETDRLKFTRELRGLLVEGFKDKADSLDAARKHFESAYRLPVDDPRAAYSYGVVLLAQKKSVVALEQFRAAAKQRKVPFLPALQGLAWTNISRGDYEQGLPALVDLARRLEESQEIWPAAHDKEHSAEWLGRMVGFLAGPGKAAGPAAPIEKLSVDIDKLLTGERKQAYQRGLQAIAVRYDELKSLAARPAAELLAEANQKREEVVAAAATADAEAKQLEDDLRELKKPHDKQIADLSRQMRSIAAKIKTMGPKIEEAETEVESLSEPKMHAQIKSQGNRRPTRKVIRNENAGEKKIRESQLASAQKKLDDLNSSLEDAKQGISKARKQRDDAQADYRKASAGKRQALQAAQHNAAELATRARDAERGALTPEKLKTRVSALEAYVPLYPELEKNRLLATLKADSH